ncbi:MAG: metalloregulator ArsR/SmtB family transcription factor [Amylibacter sp.]
MKISLEDAAQAFAALGSEQRLSVLQTLVSAGTNGLSVGELGKSTGVPGSTLNHHLRFLVHAGLVEQKKEGRSIICSSVAYDMTQALSNFIMKNCCADVSETEHSHE